MKKLIILLLVVVAGIFLYTQSITTIYAHIQAKSICGWINKEKGSRPAVGPSAYEHLQWLKKERRENCHCEVTEPNRDFNSSYVKTIVISENGMDKIRLNYTFSWGGRSFMQPIYFHHQTDFEHEHGN